MELIEVRETGRVEMACSHTFHLACIGTWLQHHTTCPMCRQVVCEQERLCEPAIPLADIALVAQYLQISEMVAVHILRECMGDIVDSILAYEDSSVNDLDGTDRPDDPPRFEGT
jgi:NACalpha-BTF3-like transcription factor